LRLRTLPRSAALLATLVAGAVGPASAHPHVFIDGGLDFVFDDAGRLRSLEVTWIYDPLTSLFMLEDLGLTASEPLAPADRERLAAYQTEWVPEFEGDSYLRHGGETVGLSGPVTPRADVRAGQIVIVFRRDLDTPIRPGDRTVAEVYDPTYFTAYRITEAPELEGAAEGCRAEVEPFEPTSGLAAIQERLLAIPIDGEPDDPDIGALFAEKIHLTCD